jgi:HEPN domain-containing protein
MVASLMVYSLLRITLFVGHISVEKLIKALYVKLHGKHAPLIHNLYRLAELCEIELADECSDWLDTITSFNINARYDDICFIDKYKL